MKKLSIAVAMFAMLTLSACATYPSDGGCPMNMKCCSGKMSCCTDKKGCCCCNGNIKGNIQGCPMRR